MKTDRKSLSSSSEDGAPSIHGTTLPLDEQEVRTGLSLLDLVKTLEYMDAVSLTQLRITRKEDGWLLMLKGTFRGLKRIAFVSCDRFEDVLVQAVTMADTGFLHWKEDNPPWERK